MLSHIKNRNLPPTLSIPFKNKEQLTLNLVKDLKKLRDWLSSLIMCMSVSERVTLCLNTLTINVQQHVIIIMTCYRFIRSK